MKFETRPETTDQKVIDEVVTKNSYERKKDKFFLRDAPVWLDLGGNIGTFTCKACEQGCKKVITFEPETENFGLLSKNVEQNDFSSNVIALNAGVVAQDDIDEIELFLCKGDYNKYRHTIFKKRGRKSVKIPVMNFKKVLKEHKPNGIKMDIEGAEIEILESMKPQDWPDHVTHLVFEYSFDVDPSIKRFKNIIDNLKERFDLVHHRKMHWDQEEYKFWPPATIVFCKNMV
jgi:FkbM family methyltransferase